MQKFPPFDPPECAEPMPLTQLEEGSAKREINFDRLRNQVTALHQVDDGKVRYPDGLEFSEAATDTFQITEGDPLSAKVNCIRLRTFARDEWQVEIKTESTMTCDTDNFYLMNRISASEANEQVFARIWEKTIPLDFQ